MTNEDCNKLRTLLCACQCVVMSSVCISGQQIGLPIQTPSTVNLTILKHYMWLLVYTSTGSGEFCWTIRVKSGQGQKLFSSPPYAAWLWRPCGNPTEHSKQRTSYWFTDSVPHNYGLWRRYVVHAHKRSYWKQRIQHPRKPANGSLQECTSTSDSFVVDENRHSERVLIIIPEISIVMHIFSVNAISSKPNAVCVTASCCWIIFVVNAE
jgi:hypothetical protein